MITTGEVYFTIPFHFNNYMEVVHMDSNTLTVQGWEKKGLIKGEHDLYDYIASFIDKDEIDNFSVSLRYDNNRLSQRRFGVKINDKNYEWKFSHMGLVLFANGIGVLWVQIDFKNIRLFTDQELQQLIYYLKEFSRSKNNRVVEYKEDCVNANEFEKRIGEFKKIYNNVNSSPLRDGNFKITYEKKSQLFLDILAPYIDFLDISTYFANRRSNHQLIPDKAIPFVRVHHSQQDEESWNVYDLAFHLGRAYKSTYLMDDEIEKSEFYQPFENTVWYASLEGCAYISFTNGDDSESPLATNNISSYFYLFILSLSQYYSLLLLTHRVMYTSMESASNRELDQLTDEIKIFIIRNYFSQVGHLTHYNEMYSYLQRKMRINILKSELEMKLQTLTSVVESRQQKIMNSFLSIFSVVGGLFALIQTGDIILKWSKNVTHVFLVTIITIVIIIGLSLFSKNYLYRRKYKTTIFNKKKL